MKQKSSLIQAKACIRMWNSRFSLPFRKRFNGSLIKFNFIKAYNWIFNKSSNKKLKIKSKNYTNPCMNFVTETSDNLKIYGSVWLADVPSNKWVIVMHGYNSSRFESLYLGWHYKTLGYNIVTFDFRNHGWSDSKTVTWGVHEKQDLISVINWIKLYYSIDEIGLVGTSMGAFTLNYFLLTEQDIIKENNIKWAISDSSYICVSTLIKDMLKRISPKFLKDKYFKVYNDILKVYKENYGIDLKEICFEKLIEEDTKYIPTLFLHNRKDRVTNYSDSFKMCVIKNNIEKNNKNKLKIFNEGFRHTKSLVEFSEEYKFISLNFVKENSSYKEKNEQ